MAVTTSIPLEQLVQDWPEDFMQDCRGNEDTFYPRDAVHSAVFAVITCLLHAGIVSKRLNLS